MGNLYRKFYLLALLVILTIAGGLYTQYVNSRTLVHENAERLAGASVAVLTRQIEGWLTMQSQVVSDAAEFIGLKRWRDEDTLEYLKALKQSNPAFASLYFASVDNRMINASGWQPPPGFDLRKRPWYVMALVQDRLIITEAFVNASKDAMIVTVAKPVRDREGTLLGVLGGDVSVETVTRLVTDKKIGKYGFSFLVDGNNNVLAHPDYPKDRLTGSTLDSDHLRAVQLAVANPDGAVKVSLRGSEGFLDYQPIAGTSWKLGSFISLEEFIRVEEQMTLAFLLVLLVSVLILLAFLFLIRRFVISPLALLKEGVASIDVDNLSEFRLPIRGNDEFAAVGRTINGLLDKASGHVDELESKVAERTQALQAANRDLTDQNMTISAMNEEIASLNQTLGELNNALENRVAEKTADLSSALAMQAVLREIAETAVRASSLDELYRTVHQLVARVLPAKNFYVSLIDTARCQLIRPYCADETALIPLHRPLAEHGLTSYVIRQRSPVFLTSVGLEQLLQNGEVTVRQLNYQSWAGAPLQDSSGNIFGAISVFSVREDDRPLRQEDLEALSIIAAQVSQAIERRRTTEALQENEERFRQSMEFSGIGYLEIDLQRRTVLMSENWRQRIGLTDRDGTYSWDDYLSHIHPDDEPLRQESMAAYMTGSAAMYEPEYRVRMADGSWNWVLARLRAVRNENGKALKLLGVLADISDLKQRAEAEKYRAEHDELTGVYNRRGLESLFREIHRDEGCLALMLIDIREFALINAAHGRAAGDEYLAGFADFLRDVFSQKAIVGRSGGAEFILLFADGDGLAKAQQAFETIESVCIQTHTGTFCVQLRCGIADGKQGACNLDELIRQADMALRQAKQESGSCCRVFDDSMLQAIDRSYAIREQLNHAMGRQEFYLEYQPVFDIRQQPPSIAGYEALLRWESALLGRVSPGEFIPVVENSNLILPLGQWVLEEACRFSLREQQRAGRFAQVAVNLSVRQLTQPDFVEIVQATLAQSGVPADALQLEVTESLLMSDFEKNAACLAQLRDRGIGISLDDFGTGYSSFTYLAKLPITTLKIDKSLTDGIDGGVQSRSAQLAESLLHMSQKMGYEVVVEGVERQEQLQALQQMGFSYCQGYLLGRPARR